jgi:phosphoribosyl-AMP cyclohydrolase (EC 3.5.4.19)
MPTSKTIAFAERGSKAQLESGLTFAPKFDADGLIPAIVTDTATGEVLMFAFMNAEALSLSIETGIAHFWSRSRAALGKKGAESGNFLNIVEMRADCDQDVVWLRVTVEGDGLACHTGRRSCFYRVLPVKSPEGAAANLRFAPDADFK